MTRATRISGFLAVVTVVALLAFAALAVAVGPVHGAKYKGHVTGQSSHERVTFRVSKGGNWVRDMKVGTYPPNKCGQGGQPPKQTTKKARIKDGKFTAHVTYRTSTGQFIEKAEVTGKFRKHRKEKGTIKTTNAPIAGGSQCTISFDYTTKAQ